MLNELAAATAHRSALAEARWILGGVESNTAAVELNHALWHIAWLARGIPTTGITAWPEAYLEFRKAREDFLMAVRRHLLAQGQDVGVEFEQFGYGVGDAACQQPTIALVERDAVGMGLACVDAGSQVRPGGACVRWGVLIYLTVHAEGPPSASPVRRSQGAVPRVGGSL
ncbi:hypothetical protein ACFWGV_21800 [Bacillus subtilis]